MSQRARCEDATHPTCEDLSVNRRATQLLGYSPEDLVGSSIRGHFADTSTGIAFAESLFQKGFTGEEISGPELEPRMVLLSCMLV